MTSGHLLSLAFVFTKDFTAFLNFCLELISLTSKGNAFQSFKKKSQRLFTFYCRSNILPIGCTSCYIVIQYKINSFNVDVHITVNNCEKKYKRDFLLKVFFM